MENILFQWLLEPSKLVLGIETTGDWERTQTGEGGGLKSVGRKALVMVAGRGHSGCLYLLEERMGLRGAFSGAWGRTLPISKNRREQISI